MTKHLLAQIKCPVVREGTYGQNSEPLTLTPTWRRPATGVTYGGRGKHMHPARPTDKQIVAAITEAAVAWGLVMDVLGQASPVQQAVVLSACPMTPLSMRDLRLTLHAWSTVAGEELVRASAFLDLTG